MTSRKLKASLLLVVLAFCLQRYLTKKEGKTIETKSGRIRGVISVSREGDEFYEWLGIPYAKPPIGPLRFASPEPIERWDDVRDGSAYGSPCAQSDLFTGFFSGSEDCLFLNVHAPKIVDKEGGKLLPVLLWIHGGYFMSGSADIHRPHYFMAHDVIVVSINYRLGALGFLSTGDSVVRGNMGLKDQSMALRWASENIQSFGGDPKQITIFGESAGASSVHLHMLSPMSQGLMQRAIAQSGSALSMWATYEDPVGQGKSFGQKVNCPTGSSAAMVECLRKADVYSLLQVHREVLALDRKKDVFFVPTVEKFVDSDTFLAEEPIKLLKAGKTAKIPLLTGFNADEGLIFTQNVIKHEDLRDRFGRDWDLVDDVVLLLPPNEKQFRMKIRDFYFGAEVHRKDISVDLENLQLLEHLPQVTQLLSDRWFTYGVVKAAMGHAHHAPTHLYFYNRTGPSIYEYLIMLKGQNPVALDFVFGVLKNWWNKAILGMPLKSSGVCHADDLSMLFETPFLFNVPKGDEYYAFSKDLVTSWVSFASSSNLADANFRGVKFPSVKPKEELKVLEICDTPKIISNPFKERIEFWKSIDKSL